MRLGPAGRVDLRGRPHDPRRLGTSTLNALWHPPPLLARTLSTLDVLSGGRVEAGLGIGWMHEEYEAVNPLSSGLAHAHREYPCFPAVNGTLMAR